MQGKPEPRPIQVVKGHAEWKYWTATPTDLAEIAQTARDLVGQVASTVAFIAEVSAPAFDASYLTAAQLRDNLKAEDLAQLTSIAIKVDEVIAVSVDEERITPARISFTVVGPSRRQAGESLKPIATLSVTGPDRDWVDVARRRMADRIARGARSTDKIINGLLVILVLLIGLTIAVDTEWGDKKKGLNGGEITSIAIGAFTGVLFVLAIFSGWIAPQLELVPEGGRTRWERAKARSKVSGKWVADLLVKAAIGALIGILIKSAL